MTHHEPDGESKAPSPSADAWRERFRKAFGDSLDLYADLFALSPAPMTVEDWSRVKPIIARLEQNDGTSIERQILDTPGLGAEIWDAIEHIAANPAVLAINRVSSEDAYDAYMDVFEPAITPQI